MRILTILICSVLFSCSKDDKDIQGTWHTINYGEATYPHVVFDSGDVKIITSESGSGWSGSYSISNNQILMKQEGSSGNYRFSFDLNGDKLYMKNLGEVTLTFPYHEFNLGR
ncbi:hypothetical protein [Sphingobacterium griseoflavum]|uniref:Lipocalin-like domain-containing protein n=1 Tax=Sphingobacterium griseoflavum TaxID=1474952 RepID=A0ABQ3HU81_9SPHI|nr:hypothetical protein [Sphingobacterium griseoflavum]GHE35177.1 hypothetical protein GCM10017764_18030 [Sphingobacterium griseoflavum]